MESSLHWGNSLEQGFEPVDCIVHRLVGLNHLGDAGPGNKWQGCHCPEKPGVARRDACQELVIRKLDIC